MMRPCLDCGEPSPATRCPDHTQPRNHDVSAARRGYDAAWRRLSKRARRLQPFCADCGAVDDLTGDHLVWPATKLEHVAVVCRACNSKRGARRSKQTRGGNPRETAQGPLGKAKFESHTESQDVDTALVGVDRLLQADPAVGRVDPTHALAEDDQQARVVEVELRVSGEVRLGIAAVSDQGEVHARSVP